MSWRDIMRATPSTHYHQNPQNIALEMGSVGSEDIKLRSSIPEASPLLPSDIADHFHERAGTLEFDGQCPRELADYVAQLETLQWWLQSQHPEILAQWLFLAATISP